MCDDPAKTLSTQAERTKGRTTCSKIRAQPCFGEAAQVPQGLVLAGGLFSAWAQDRELKVGYMKNPIQDASLEMMEKWAKTQGVKLTPVPMAYSVFMEKVTSTLTSGADQFDVIWHNDDWGQLWKKWLETDRRRERHRKR